MNWCNRSHVPARVGFKPDNVHHFRQKRMRQRRRRPRRACRSPGSLALRFFTGSIYLACAAVRRQRSKRREIGASGSMRIDGSAG